MITYTITLSDEDQIAGIKEFIHDAEQELAYMEAYPESIVTSSSVVIARMKSDIAMGKRQLEKLLVKQATKPF